VKGRALILGAAGFIGSHLARRLVRDGWHVVGVVRSADVLDATTRVLDVRAEVDWVEGDCADADLLARLVRGADAVFPLAGHSGAARSMDAPLADAAANASGQLAVLEALRRVDRDARIVFPGSRLQYGRPLRLPVDEDHPQDPTSIYGLHKMLGERYHRLYAEHFGIQTCCLRISNPYGPGQDRPDHSFGVVGTFLGRAARGEELRLYGGGTQQREYVYIDDLVELLVLAVTHPDAVGASFNAGGPRPVSLREMTEAVVRTVGAGRIVSVPWPPSDAAVETGDYVGDIRRAAAALGWTPRVDLDRGLAATWAELAPVLAAR
jgi:nucleoside-diphosphate-sugar epimerase